MSDINIPYLTKILNTNKLAEVIAEIDTPPLDYNLAVWAAIDAGEIEVDDDKGTITLLKEPTASSDPELTNKLLRVVQHYAKNGANVTRGRLNSYVKDVASGEGYQWHEYIMAMQHLVDQGTIVEDVIDVPKSKKRPAHKFVFVGLPENNNEEMNAKSVNKWIDTFSKVK